MSKHQIQSNNTSQKSKTKEKVASIESERAPLVPDLTIVKKVLAEAKSDIRVDRQLPPVLPINLSFNNLFVWTKAIGRRKSDGKIRSFNKSILDGISGSFMEGTSTAILGPSGSGKTTLLNFICSNMRKSKNLFVSGKLFVNGHNLNSIHEMRHRLGYVMQQDDIFDHFTPRELFTITADLAGIPYPKAKVNEVIDLLGLEKCENTQIGPELDRRLSGGQLKRTSIGLELITDPTIILLDEPTTGLDSKSALDVAKILKMLAKNGRTVITTIHQPSKEILERFDNVMCLCDGKLIYDGPPDGLASYCESVGYPVPNDATPADHIMKILSDDDIKIKALEENKSMNKQDIRKEFKKRLRKFEKQYHKGQKAGKGSAHKKMKKSSQEEFDELKTVPAVYKRSSCKAAWVLYKRFFLFFLRKASIFYLKFVKTTIEAVVQVSLFSHIVSYKDDTLGNLQSKSGMIFAVMSHAAFGGVYSSISGFLPTLKPFLREHRKKMYSPVIFYLMSSIYALPMQMVLLLYYQLLIWFLIDIKQGWESFFKYFVTLFAAYTAGIGFGDFLTLVVREREKLNQLVLIAVTPLLLTSGVAVVVSSLPKPLFWLSYINFFRFAYQAGFYIEFNDQLVKDYLRFCKVRPPDCYSSDCAVEQSQLPVCDPFNIPDFAEKDYWVNIYYLLIHGLIFRILSVCLFYRWSRDTPIPYKTLPKAALRRVRTKVRALNALLRAVKATKLKSKNTFKIPAPQLKKKSKSF